MFDSRAHWVSVHLPKSSADDWSKPVAPANDVESNYGYHPKRTAEIPKSQR